MVEGVCWRGLVLFVRLFFFFFLSWIEMVLGIRENERRRKGRTEIESVYVEKQSSTFSVWSSPLLEVIRACRLAQDIYS